MRITVDRLWKKETYTIGKMTIDGKYLCNTLEDKVRDLTKESKVFGRTAIPAGTYRVTMTYSPKFKRVMPLVNGVPQFEAIRIHPGNKAEDTDGCILVGENTVIGGLTNSRKWSNELNKRIQNALAGKEDVLIIINN